MLLSNHSANTDDAPATNDVTAGRASSPPLPSSAAAPPHPRHRLSLTPSSDTDGSTAGAPQPRHRAPANDTAAAASSSKSPGKTGL